jgi:3',5'-cyclic-AMP phosphodiesterase
MCAALQPGLLSFVHFGDLHVTDAQSNNYRDFHALIDEVNTHMRDGVGFGVLPGDNADDGTPEQFALVRRAIDRLALPIHILPGDHDFKTKSLDNFYEHLAARPLPFSFGLNGYRCLFLDIVSAGTGGPDFRLGRDWTLWLDHQLNDADSKGEQSVVFMHSYPADLKENAEEIAALFARHHVVFVDMGHTHYNELANDGRTIYAATRSTGQIEEGPPGFSVVAIDKGLVSWRFKLLGEPWPFVLITSPADRHLATELSDETLAADGLEIRALAWSGAGIASVSCAIDGGAGLPMTRTAESPTWSRSIAMPADRCKIWVRAEDAHGAIGTDTISVARRPLQARPNRFGGSDAHSIGAWPERHIFGTQLGPNRNGRHW